MSTADFERRLNDFLAENSVVLTPLNVAFSLNMDVAETALLMADLAREGTLVLDSGEGETALYRRPGHAVYETDPKGSSVGEPISPGAINQMPLNMEFPGLGSLVTLNPRGCLPVLALFIGAVVMAVMLPGWNKLFAGLPILAAIAWSLFIGMWDYFRDNRSGKDRYLS